jgi:hypothetical protein
MSAVRKIGRLLPVYLRKPTTGDAARLRIRPRPDISERRQTYCSISTSGALGASGARGQLADLFLEISGRLNTCRSNSGIGRSL